MKTKDNVRKREIYRHPILEFRAALKAGRISRLPHLCPGFKVALPPTDDFVVRFLSRGARLPAVTFLRSANGLTANRTSSLRFGRSRPERPSVAYRSRAAQLHISCAIDFMSVRSSSRARC